MSAMRASRAGLRAAALLLCPVLFSTAACAPAPTQAPPRAEPPEAARAPDPRLIKVADVPAARGWLKIQPLSRAEILLHDGATLWSSRDGGKHWEAIFQSGPDALYEIEAFQFLSADAGFVLRRGLIHKTVDGGRTWALLSVTPAQHPEVEVLDFKFFEGGRIGWAVGGAYRPKTARELSSQLPNNLSSPDGKGVVTEAVFRTDDGGATWKRQTTPAGVGRLYRVHALGPARAFAFGYGGVLTTKDGGGTWRPARFAPACSDPEVERRRAASVSFADSDAGWLSYVNGYVAKTSDGGDTWCDFFFPDSLWPEDYHAAYFEKIYFTGAKHGWALEGGKLLYESLDGGAHWEKVSGEGRYDDLYVLDAENAWVVSREGLFRVNPSSAVVVDGAALIDDRIHVGGLTVAGD